MEKYFSIIDRLEKHSLPAIAKQAPKIGLFAGSIELNTKAEKYHLFAIPGEATPIAYERKGTMEAFVGHLCRIASTGQDLQYQPTMRASEELKGSGVLVYCQSEIKLTDEATRLQLPTKLGAYKIANLLGKQAIEHSAQIVIIDDAADIVGSNTREAFAMFNSVARAQGLLLLVGFNVAKATEETNAYLARHAHNLCQLTEGSIELVQEEADPKTVNYFCFTYGRPIPNRIVYTIDESGAVKIPPTPITDLLRMQECAKELATKPIAQAKFVDRAFGFFHGEFQPTSIYGMITASTEQGTLHKSGTNGKVTICLSEATPSRNPYKGVIALTALGDASSKATQHTAKRKAVAKFGEFKLLNIDNDIPAKMGKNFMAYLIKAIATKGKVFGGCIEIKSPHRNTLVIVIGTKDLAEKLQAYVGNAINAELEIVSTNGEITDSDLLHLYKAKANQKPRDFVLIVGLNDAKQTDFTPIQLAKEMAITAKYRGFLTIAQTSGWSINDLLQFVGDEVWKIRPLISNADQKELSNCYGKVFPNYYIFEATANNYPFRGKFDDGGHKPIKDHFQKALLTSVFYYCNQTPANEIDATETMIRQARKCGLIKVQYTSTKNSIKESLITFVK